MQVNEQHISEIKALISSGDVSLTERREVIKTLRGRPTELSDDNLIRAIAATDDDDEDLFLANVAAIEAE